REVMNAFSHGPSILISMSTPIKRGVVVQNCRSYVLLSAMELFLLKIVVTYELSM
ncbi:unnamed protein product, partial [Sphenostylis stenocarpa]